MEGNFKAKITAKSNEKDLLKAALKKRKEIRSRPFSL
jgi:hypothetical protein